MNNNYGKRVYGNELKYLTEVLENEFRSSKGSMMMTRLEQAFSKRFNSNYAISHINGTATMHSILEAIGVGPGDEVIVPPLTMSSTSFVVLETGATPVFADVDLNTFEISPDSIRERITNKTKAIITVALYGLSPDMDPIMEIAEARSLFVIEDNAQCFLGEYKGKLVGTIGHAASFSFQSSKHLTSGEGGIVITNDKKLADAIRRVSSLGYAGVGAEKGKITKQDIQDPEYSRHIELGWNYRMPELCSAVALAQLENIDQLVNIRVKAAEMFNQAARGTKLLRQQSVGMDYKHSYWTWAAVLEDANISWKEFRNKFVEFGGDGIYAAWKLTYLEPMFETKSFLGREKYINKSILESYKPGLCPNAEYLQKRILQFKTNYWDLIIAEQQAEILSKTIKYFQI